MIEDPNSDDGQEYIRKYYGGAYRSVSYDQGGLMNVVAQTQVSYLSKPERVLTAEKWEAFGRLGGAE